MNRYLLALVSVLFVTGCSHPLEIVGEGDIVSASGQRSCSLLEYQAQTDNCDINLVLGGYSETYSALPHAGWEFVRWENCAMQFPDCGVQIDAAYVQLFWGFTAEPLIAVFQPLVVNAPPQVTNVQVIDNNGGRLEAGDTVSVSYQFDDVDSDPEGVSLFQWYLNGSPIVAATSATYLVAPGDGGSSLSVQVTPVAQTGDLVGTPVASAFVVIDSEPPQNSPPQVANVVIVDGNGGSADVGDSVSVDYVYSDSDGDAEGASEIEWRINGAPIAGATGVNYVVVAADAGGNLSVQVTPVAQSGIAEGAAGTSASVLINSVPQVNTIQIVDGDGGNVEVGDTVTVTYQYSDIDADVEGESLIQWFLNGAVIGGATNLSYAVVSGDAGGSLSVQVAPVAASGSPMGVAGTSASVAVSSPQQGNSAPQVSGVAIVDGNGGSANIGDSVSVSYAYSDVDADPEGSSLVQWFIDGSAIGGASGSSYSIAVGDAGRNLSVQVTPVAQTGVQTGVAGTSASVVINSAPQVSGIVVVDSNGGSVSAGDTLSVSYTYSDADSDTEGSSLIQWTLDGNPIGGATDATYSVSSGDEGGNLGVQVTPVAQSGTATGAAGTSASVVVNSAPEAGSVAIVDGNGGSVSVGDTLSVSYAYSDADSDPEGGTMVQWLRSGNAIVGATSADYEVVPADIGNTLSVRVTPVAQSGTQTGTAVTSGASAVNAAPEVSSVEIVDGNGGSVDIGDTVSVSYVYSDADSDPQGSSSVQWLLDGNPIGGATGTDYTVLLSNAGAALSVQVIPAAVSGTPLGATGTSNAVVVNSAPQVSGVAIVDGNGGSVSTGDTISVSYVYTDADSDPEGGTLIQWLRDGNPVGGATNTSYLVSVGDAGSSLSVRVTPVAQSGTQTGVAVTSGSSAVNSAPTVSNITLVDGNGGSVDVGDTVGVTYLYNDVDSDPEGSSGIQWLLNDSPIGGATGSTYDIDAADVGGSLSVQVTPVAQTGVLTGVSANSAAVVINSAPQVSSVAIVDGNGSSVDVGDSVSVSYLYSDVDADAEGASLVQWLLNGNPIGGATSSSYSVQASDAGSNLSVQVTPVAQSGTPSGTPDSSASVLVNSAPSISSVAIVDGNGGSVEVGDTVNVSYSYSDADSDTEGGSQIQWYLDGNPIGGATGTSYVVLVADSGSNLSVQVTPVAASGTPTGTTQASSPVTVGGAAPPVRLSNTTCTPPSVDVVPGQITVEPAFSNIPSLTVSSNVGPMAMVQPPLDSSYWFIARRDGVILRMVDDADTSSLTTVLDISSSVSTSGERGLTGLAFHPDFPNDNRIFVLYNDGNNGGQSTISSFEVNPNTWLANGATEDVKLTLPRLFGIQVHNGGDLAFGPDGYLYAAFGDSDAETVAQQRFNLHGSMIRIDVSAASGYTIPADNPFNTGQSLCSAGSRASGDCPEIYAYGFRNPWRFSIDQQTGDVWVGDVGAEQTEEVSRLTAGNNYGWPIMEGSGCNGGGSCDTSGLSLPITDYGRSQGASVIGGYVYRGSDVPELQGEYIFTDAYAANIFSVSSSASPVIAPTVQLNNRGGFAAMAQGNDGEIYFLALNSDAGDSIYRLGGGDSYTVNMEQQLTDTGCFDVPTLSSPSGVFDYELNSQLWSDGLYKTRAFAIPDGATIDTASADGDFEFPVGSVLIKHFLCPDQITYKETRLMINFADPVGWQGYSYQWNDAQTAAALVVGDVPVVVDACGNNHSIPTRQQCFICHTDAAYFSLGIESKQQNIFSLLVNGNILDYISEAGYLTDSFDSSVEPQLYGLADATGTLEERARSYLHSNCSGCHRPDSGNRIGDMDLRYDTAFVDTGLCDVVPSLDDFGIPGARRVAPGNADASVLLLRMEATDGTRMPPLATDIVHTEATTLMRDWINGLSSCP